MGLLTDVQFQQLLDSVRKLEVGQKDFVVLRYPDIDDESGVQAFADRLYFFIKQTQPEWQGQVLLLHETFGLEALTWLADVALRGVDEVLAELRDQRCSKEQLLETIELLKKTLDAPYTPKGTVLNQP